MSKAQSPVARADQLHGVLAVDKPTGPTSHDIVAQARRFFHTKRVGHAGTLDPMASGVLVLLFGEGTKLSSLITSGEKAYRATFAFGRSTDSHDAEGATLVESTLAPDWTDESRLRQALAVEAQRLLQVPPSVSAVKIGGKRAYRLHRAGEAPALEPRSVAVHALALTAWSPERLTIELRVSKGYYVRGLARDLASSLGVPLHLAELRRLSSGGFRLEEACPWPLAPGTTPIPLRHALGDVLQLVRLTHGGVVRARQGRELCREDFLDEPPQRLMENAEPGALAAWTDPSGLPVALGYADGEKFIIQRGFSPELSESVLAAEAALKTELTNRAPTEAPPSEIARPENTVPSITTAPSEATELAES